MGILSQDTNHIMFSDESILNDGFKRRPQMNRSCIDIDRLYWNPFGERVFVKGFDYFGQILFLTYDADVKSMLITCDGFHPINNKSIEYLNIISSKIEDWADFKIFEKTLADMFSPTIQHL